MFRQLWPGNLFVNAYHQVLRSLRAHHYAATPTSAHMFIFHGEQKVPYPLLNRTWSCVSFLVATQRIRKVDVKITSLRRTG